MTDKPWSEVVTDPQSPDDFRHKDGRQCKYAVMGLMWTWKEGVCERRHDGSM